jgi:hypothetical protein
MYGSTFFCPLHWLEVSCQLNDPAAGKEPRYPLDRSLGLPQDRSGRFGDVKILDPTGTRISIPLSSSP